jgi:hypothetical protein
MTPGFKQGRVGCSRGCGWGRSRHVLVWAVLGMLSHARMLPFDDFPAGSCVAAVYANRQRFFGRSARALLLRCLLATCAATCLST